MKLFISLNENEIQHLLHLENGQTFTTGGRRHKMTTNSVDGKITSTLCIYGEYSLCDFKFTPDFSKIKANEPYLVLDLETYEP